MLPSITFSESNNSNNLIKSHKDIEAITKSTNYQYLSKEELNNLINEKKKKIIEYYNINKSLKKELTDILKKLNSLNPNQSNLKGINLQTRLNLKKKDYLKNKSNNTLLKDEYALLLKKLKPISEKDNANIIYEKRLNIEKLKEENFEIKKEINKKQNESAKTQNEVIKIRNNNLFLQNLDSYGYKLKKYIDIKNKYIKPL